MSVDSPVEVPWDALDTLQRGGKLLKIGRRGKPEFREVKVTEDFTKLMWESKKEKDGWMQGNNIQLDVYIYTLDLCSMCISYGSIIM